MMLSLLIFSTAEGTIVCSKREPLFQIARSKNKNVVKYDVCLLPNDNVSDANPVDAYWILEDGTKKELSAIENKEAYGINSKEKLGENKFRIALAALKDRSLIIQKTKAGYKAVIQINGELSILERVYVQSEEHALGLPKVDYVDLFGRSMKTNKPVRERITPK